MTNEEIEKYPFKYYNPALQSLSTLKVNLETLGRNEEAALLLFKPKGKPTSQFSAEHSKGTIFNEGIYRTELCVKHTEMDDGDRIKTALGWLPKCCADELNIPRLESTPTPHAGKSAQAIEEEFADRRKEIELLIGYKQRISTAKAVATKKALKQSLSPII